MVAAGYWVHRLPLPSGNLRAVVEIILLLKPWFKWSDASSILNARSLMGFRSTDGVELENSDLPSISSQFKYLGPEQRASSFSPRGFAADCVGAALTINACSRGMCKQSLGISRCPCELSQEGSVKGARLSVRSRVQQSSAQSSSTALQISPCRSISAVNGSTN